MAFHLAEILGRLGMPKLSATVYLELEKNPGLSATHLVQKTSVHRPALYRSLVALVHAGVVYKKKEGKRFVYGANDRSRIAKLFAETESDLAKFTEARQEEPTTSVVKHFTGRQGVAAVFEDVLAHTRRGDTFYRYTAEKNLDEVNSMLPHNYRARRDNKRLERLVISNPESGSQKRPRLERFVRFLGNEKESFRQNAIQIIYGSRIACVDLNTLESFIIENKTLAEFQKTIFHALYKRL